MIRDFWKEMEASILFFIVFNVSLMKLMKNII